MPTFYRVHVQDLRYNDKIGLFRRIQYNANRQKRMVVKMRSEQNMKGPEKAVKTSNLTPLHEEFRKAREAIRDGVMHFCRDTLYQADNEMKKLGTELDAFSVDDLTQNERAQRRAMDRYLQSIEDGVSLYKREKDKICRPKPPISSTRQKK